MLDVEASAYSAKLLLIMVTGLGGLAVVWAAFACPYRWLKLAFAILAGVYAGTLVWMLRTF